MQHKIDRVILVSFVQIVPIVKIGLNGVFVVPHVVQEQEHELNHVVTQVVQIIPKVKTVIPTIVLSYVKQIAIVGVHGHLALLPVVVVFQPERVFVQDRLKMHVNYQKIRLVERIHVRQILVSLVLVQLVLGLNGVNAVRHVVVEFKTDSDCCVAQVAIPKKTVEYVRQIVVPIRVKLIVHFGQVGVIVRYHVVTVTKPKLEIVLFQMFLDRLLVRFQILSLVQQNLAKIALPTVQTGHHGVTVLLLVAQDTEHVIDIARTM